MECYNPENQTSETYHANQAPKSFFPRSELNDWTPRWEKIVFFCLGFLGIEVINYVVQLVLVNLPNMVVYSGSSASFTTLGATLDNFLVYTIMVLAFLAFLFFDKRKTYVRVFSGFKDPYTYVWALLGLGLVLGPQLLISNIFAMAFPFYGNNDNQSALVTMATSYPVLICIETIFFAPFVEELTYRVGLVDTLGHNYKTRWVGIVSSAILFGLIHTDFITPLSTIAQLEASKSATAEQILAARYELYNELLNLPIYMLSGFGLAYTYARSGKIASSMTTHLVNNLISMVEIFIAAASATNIRVF